MGKILRSSSDIALRALLTEAREAEGLTQEQLARRLSKPQSYVWKLENGERVLAYAEAPAYARALGMKFSEFSSWPATRIKSGVLFLITASTELKSCVAGWYSSS